MGQTATNSQQRTVSEHCFFFWNLCSQSGDHPQEIVEKVMIIFRKIWPNPGYKSLILLSSFWLQFKTKFKNMAFCFVFFFVFWLFFSLTSSD
jgi:hypothetical protein